MMIDDQQFDQMVESSWEKIPRRFKDEIENVSIVIENRPSPEKLAQLGVKGTLLGLFEGTPKTALGQAVNGIQPSKITLYRDSLLGFASSEKELANRIHEVLMHEIAHYFGYNEESLYTMDKKLRKRLAGEST